MRYKSIENKLYINNRKKYLKNVEENSVSIFVSNDPMPTNADETLPFIQNTNLLYLTGIDQEDTYLILAPNFPDERMREILFIKETSEEISIWEGNKLSKDEARKISGIQNIMWNDEFNKIIPLITAESNNVYLDKNEHIRSSTKVETAQDRFLKNFKSKNNSINIQRSYPILSSLRMIKDKVEIDLISHACKITEKGFRRVLKFIKPGVNEYDIEAELIHEFIINKSKGFAYQPIIATGINACSLHYNDNNTICKSGELVLMDVAAEYGNYSADLTRTLPVSGRFTKRQKEIYNAVLFVKNEATKLLRTGVIWKDFHIEVGKIMTSELLKLGLLDKSDVQNETNKNPAYKKYFMHGTSHHLGLNTHDYGLLHLPMETNMVFTVEPGIYIPEEGLGIRLEDDVVIQKSGAPLNLMSNIPIEAEEIEDLMNK